MKPLMRQDRSYKLGKSTTDDAIELMKERGFDQLDPESDEYRAELNRCRACVSARRYRVRHRDKYREYTRKAVSKHYDTHIRGILTKTKKPTKKNKD